MVHQDLDSNLPLFKVEEGVQNVVVLMWMVFSSSPQIKVLFLFTLLGATVDFHLKHICKVDLTTGIVCPHIDDHTVDHGLDLHQSQTLDLDHDLIPGVDHVHGLVHITIRVVLERGEGK